MLRVTVARTFQRTCQTLGAASRSNRRFRPMSARSFAVVEDTPVLTPAEQEPFGALLCPLDRQQKRGNPTHATPLH